MIIKFSDLKNIQNEDTTYVSGVFDLTHAGHFELFKKAKELFPNYKLVVGIMGDKRVKLKKGENRPILTEKERITMIDGNKYVDYCFIYKKTDLNNPNFKNVIKILKPKAYVCQNKKRVRDPFYKNLNVEICPAPRTKGVSTTEIISRVLEKYKK